MTTTCCLVPLLTMVSREGWHEDDQLEDALVTEQACMEDKAILKTKFFIPG